MFIKALCAVTLVVSSTILDGQAASTRNTTKSASAGTFPNGAPLSAPDPGDQSSTEIAAARKQVRTACHYNPSQTSLRKIQKVNNCEAKAILNYLQTLRLEDSLDVTASDSSLRSQTQGNTASNSPAAVAGPGAIAPAGINAIGNAMEMMIVPPALAAGGVRGAVGAAGALAPSPPASQPNQIAPPAMSGSSLSGTPTTCGGGSGSNDLVNLRVHRVIMTPQVAADDFGSRLAHRFIVYQVSIENENKDYQYMLQDVSVDFSRSFRAEPGTYKYNASGQDLTLLRGVPEKGQDMDKRNAILHVLQGIGSVAGGVSGLTSFSDVMGSSVAVFNGAFLQAYTAIAPDHTANQLNRLSDSAFMANTVIDKQRAKTIALFVPEDEIMSKYEQGIYWKDPNNFVSFARPTGILYDADICVDGTFIQSVTVVSPTLSAATVSPGSAVGQTVKLTVTGTNLVQGDTQVVVGNSPNTITAPVITTDGKTGSAQISLPVGYVAGTTTAILQSKSNPSLTSGKGVVITEK